MSSPTPPPAPRSHSTSPDLTRGRAALSGVLAAAAGLAVGEAVAALSPRWPSPVVAVGDVVIDNTPPPVARWAIDTFGTADKAVLIAGTLVLLTVAAAGIGMLARRRLGLAIGGVAVFGALAALATFAAPAAGPSALLAPIGTAVTATVVLIVLLSGLARQPVVVGRALVDRPLAALSRRRFLTLASVVVAGTAATASAGRVLLGTFDVAAARRELALPEPARTVDLPLPEDVSFAVDGLTPYLTPNADFYRIDVNLELPRIDPASHELRVVGMVDRELRIPFRELLRRDLVELPLTMTCVSNEVGGGLVGNAIWRGIPLRDLLDEAGVQPDADQIVGRSVDGYTGGFPVSAAYDRDAMVVVGMNGEPLPVEHGFPLRLVTPGIYGYVGATKWLTEIELTRFDAFDQYWVPRGYDALAPIKTQARIDTPRGLATVDPGTVTVAGVAWAQTRGIERVESRVDDGGWREAELAPAVGNATWVPWRFTFDASPGRHQVTVRATDATGATQTEERTSVAPNGASGWHTSVFTVRDA